MNSQQKKLYNLLKKYKLTLSAAESCTGGKLSNYITDIPGISEFFKGSLIAYSNETKKKVLDVSEYTLKK
jgi:nicotinamide-nucleotide amidase